MTDKMPEFSQESSIPMDHDGTVPETSNSFTFYQQPRHSVKRTGAKRLCCEHSQSSTGMGAGFRPPGNGKRLVIHSLRVPILSAVTSKKNLPFLNKPDRGPSNMTRWPEIRFFVCVIQATTTLDQNPIKITTRLVDTMDELIYRFSSNNATPYNELGNGYVEFINRQNNSLCHSCPHAESNPFIIDGLDNGQWEIRVELCGLYPAESDNNMKQHVTSAPNKLSSSVTPNSSKDPNNELLKVQTDMCQQKLAYCVITSSNVNHQKFTLNKVHQSQGSTSTSKSDVPVDEPEVACICMELLEDGEKCSIMPTSSHEENLVIKSLKLPPNCKLTEGFITLFDDISTRVSFKPNKTPKWQHFLNRTDRTGMTTCWNRLWFKLEIINDPSFLKDDDARIKEILHPQTVVLKYWLNPEHVEQNKEPGGIIDLGACLPLSWGIVASKPRGIGIRAAAVPLMDSSIKQNILEISLSADNCNIDELDYDILCVADGPILLAFDTQDERMEWCDTINGAVSAIDAHQEYCKILREQLLKKK